MWRGYQNLQTVQVLHNRSSIPFETAYELTFQAFSLFHCLVLSTWQISTRKKTNQKAVPQNYLPANLFKFKYHYTNRKSAKIVYPRWFIFMWISLLVLTFFFLFVLYSFSLFSFKSYKLNYDNFIQFRVPHILCFMLNNISFICVFYIRKNIFFCILLSLTRSGSNKIN